MIRNIRPLTSLRFFFCLLVFSYHLKFLRTSSDSFLSGIYERIFLEGYIGVSFFFILSGFILTHNYFDKLVNHTISKRTFYLGRIMKIYPLHILTFIISLPLMEEIIYGNPGRSLGLVLIHLSLIQSYIPISDIYFKFNNPSWFISDETFFYLLTPLLFLLFSKFLTAKYILFIYLSLIGLILIGIHITPVKLQHSLYYINPLTRIFDFIIGILLYFFYKNLNPEKYSTRFATSMEMLAILLFILFFYFHQQVPQAYRFSIYYWLPVSFILLVFSIGKGYISKIFSCKQLVYLGEISFSFYMLHELIIRYYSFIFMKMLGFSGYYLINTLAILAITLILSILSFEFYEKRIYKYLKKGFLNPKLKI